MLQGRQDTAKYGKLACTLRGRKKTTREVRCKLYYAADHTLSIVPVQHIKESVCKLVPDQSGFDV